MGQGVGQITIAVHGILWVKGALLFLLEDMDFGMGKVSEVATMIKVQVSGDDVSDIPCGISQLLHQGLGRVNLRARPRNPEDIGAQTAEFGYRVLSERRPHARID